MYDNVVECMLRQHTPMINYEHDQPGATLRATEFKPLFDRFLLETLNLRGLPTIPGQDGALDYHLRITAIGETEKSDPNAKLYFAFDLMEPDQRPKALKHENVRLRFVCFSDALRAAITKHIDYFLALHNFGTRSGKGFGGFEREGSRGCVASIPASHPVYKITYPSDTWEHKVNAVHTRLKSGFNLPNRSDLYEKSYLFEYMCDIQTRWEKRKIKEEFPSVIHWSHKSPVECRESVSSYHFIRALLGLSGSYAFHNDQIVDVEHPVIKRFKSPIIYKAIGNDVYLLPNESYLGMLGQTFTFTLGEESFTIDTPKDFSLEAFLDDACNRADENGKRLIERVPCKRADENGKRLIKRVQ